MILSFKDVSKDLIIDHETPLDFGSPVQWLSGEWYQDGSDYYFEDKSGNGYDAEIIDFDLSGGFPYKSAAKIRQPSTGVAYDALFAADDGFWYSAANTPRDIPVVSLFQNIHYSNKIFTRHTTSKINANGSERHEPTVIDITTYPAALAGTNLTNAIDYFGVPTKDGTAYWVDGVNGNDADTGGEGDPWKTVDKAADTVNDGSLIYVKTGSYPGDAALQYIYDPNNNEIQVIGYAITESPSVSNGIRPRDANMTLLAGFYVKPQAALTRGIYGNNSTALIISSVYLENIAGSGVQPDFLLLENSVLTGVATTMVLVDAGVYDRTITDNLISGVIAGIGISILINGDHTINNNLFKNNGGGCIKTAQATGSLTVLGNTFSPVAGSYIIDTTTDIGIDVLYNVFNLIAAATDNPVTFTGGVNNVPLVDGNTFNNEGGLTGGIVLVSNSPIKAENNIFNGSTVAMASGAELRCSISLNGVYSEATFNNNSIRSKRSGDYILAVGSENTNAGDNDIVSISLQRNYIEGLDKAGAGTAQTTHGLFVGFQIDAVLRYNFIWGSSYGFVLKGSAGTIYTSGGVTYNIIRECSKGVLLKGSQSVTVANNTMVNKTIDASYGVQLTSNVGGDDSDNCTIKNNIFIFLGTGVNYAIRNGLGASNDIDYNIYYCPNGTLTFQDGGVDKTFAQWQTLGYDANSIVLTDAQYAALFEDVDDEDYSLPVGSIAIDFGDSSGDGLDSTTEWTRGNIPVIVTKSQTGDAGAYVS